jgi:cation diffusion facilitator CzcD-associated flavoprotein CzcO
MRVSPRGKETFVTDQAVLESTEQAGGGAQPQFEVVVLGSGVSGIYQIKRLVDLGVNAVVLSSDADLGGTWFNNRYPGARFDSESYTYGYSFSKELLEEWHWKERFSSQPENLKYLNFVAEKFDLRPHMRFSHTVKSMTFDEANDLWRIRIEESDEELTTRFVITALGLLSIPTLPRYPGMETFEGLSFHTFAWPHEPIDLSGKRVGVIGTGATGIQVIADIADEVGHLTVFQRRPNWAAPLSNGPISDQEMADIRARYEEIFATCARSPGGFEHEPDRRGFYNLTKEERIAFWDSLYGTPGFAVWLRNFVEIFVDEEANAEFSEYIANRIRERVKDPKVAEKLIPRDHGFGVQRVPMETNYYEVFNRENVDLVDISDTPIEEITPTGVRTSEGHVDLDVIVYATGFDAITGAFDRIDITGTGGQKLRDKWWDGPSTYLGAMVHGFPNLAMIAGPQSASASVNFPRSIETAVDWITDFFTFVQEHGYRRFDATAEAEQSWTDHVRRMYSSMLMRNAKSWFTGYNSNVEGHEHGKVRYFVYNGGQPKFNERITKVAQNGYEGVDFA